MYIHIGTDFFETSQSTEVRHCSERYIPKSGKDYYIIMESTANKPDNLFDIIFHEQNSLYTLLTLPYTYGVGKRYTLEEVEQSRKSPSFQREMECKFLGVVGNVFTPQSINLAIERGRLYRPPENINEVNFSTTKVLACDPGFGNSKFGICLAQMSDKQIQILEADEYHRPDFNEMIGTCGIYCRNMEDSISKIYVDGANPSFIKSLKLQMGEPEDYDEVIKESKQSGRNPEIDLGVVVPINFNMESKSMLANAKMLMERDGGFIAINPNFDKLIAALRTATEKGELQLDKEATLHDDLFDSFRMAMRFFFFRDKAEAQRKIANVESFQFKRTTTY